LKSSIKDILLDPEKYEWDHDVFINTGNVLDIETEVLIIDSQEFDYSELPKPTTERGLSSFLSISQIQDVISNLEAQRNGSDLILRLKALVYYYENDAFYKI
jgi:hypothetical protein